MKLSIITKAIAGGVALSALLTGAALADPAVIYDLGGKFDKSFNEAAFNGAQRWAEEEQLPLLGQVPVTRALRESGDGGTPLVVLDPGDPSAVELRLAARRIARQVGSQALSSLPMA